MTQAITFARPYARAAFALAKTYGRLSQWSQLLGFAAVAAADPAVQPLFGDPRVAASTVTGLLVPPGDVDPTFAKFLDVLSDNRRLALLPEVAALFEQLRAEAEQVLRAKVVSAHPLDEAELAKLRESLKRRFGREVELAATVDPALIGGAVIDTGDTVIDGSLRTKLARLGATLAH